MRLGDAILIYLAEHGGMTQDTFAGLIGVSRQTVNRWIKGGPVKRENAERLAKILGVTVEQILAQSDIGNVEFPDDSPYGSVPEVSWTDAGRGVEATDPYPPGTGRTMVVVRVRVSEDAFALQIKGDSMEPDYFEGDQIVVDPRLEPMDGEAVLAKFQETDEVTLKYYKPRGTDDAGDPVFDLVPANPNHETVTVNSANPADIIGVVVQYSGITHGARIRGMHRR